MDLLSFVDLYNMQNDYYTALFPAPYGMYLLFIISRNRQISEHLEIVWIITTSIYSVRLSKNRT